VQKKTAIAVSLLFAASGCAASVYQIVWFQMLNLVIGASAISLGVVLATFMGGLCLGSLLFRFISPRHHPLVVFAFIELGIALLGLAVFYTMPVIAGIYAGWAGSGVAGIVLRAAVAAFCLLPPTILMGATLPAVTRWVDATPRGASWVGFFYAANIGGAVLGSVVAGFYVLAVYDVGAATLTAAGLNMIVALASLILASARGYIAVPSASEMQFPRSDWRIYVTTALSGMTALSAEVLWTRHLSLLLGGTVYTFSLILAVFLTGLGIGSAVGSVSARFQSARKNLGVCQLLLCAAIAWASYALAKSLPYWPIDVMAPSTSGVQLQLDLMRTMWAIFPAALLWGASFPLAVAAASDGAHKPDHVVGGLYAANTLGAISGALATSFVLVVSIGSRSTHQLLIVITACSGLLMLLRLRPVFALTCGLFVAAMVYIVPALPWDFVAYGRFTPTRGRYANVIYMREGLTSSVAVSEDSNGHRTYHNSGKPEASSYPPDLRLQRMLGHLTTLVPKTSNSFLVIGLGTGATAGAVGIDPGAKRVVIADIEPLSVEIASKYFSESNFEVVDNPKSDIRIDDGRHYLATTSETFDGITVDPLDPWVKGAAALYTREFWNLCRSRLNPGGVVTVFVQLYETTEEAVKSEVATFLDVFPNGVVFANTVQGMGYDLVLLGRSDDAPIDIDQMNTRLQNPSYAPVMNSLKEIGFHSAVELLATYAGRSRNMSQWLNGAIINTDRNLRLQYLAAQGLNVYQANVIFGNMFLTGQSFPRDLFTGSPDQLATLEQIFRARRGEF